VPHAIFDGEYELTIDEKSRLLVPAEVRKCLNPERDGTGFVLIVGVNRRPWLYPDKAYEAIVSQAEEDFIPDEDTLAFDQLFFAMASRVELDKQGRILIPDKTLRRTATGREVVMIGARSHLEIWNRSDWESQFNENLSRLGELAKRARKARLDRPT
jgi:MraZ protein